MKTITREQAKNYGKYAATAVVGIGVGLAGYTVNDTPTQKTDAYQNLNQTLQDAQSDNAELEDQVSDLETTVTEKEDRVTNLESQVTQFNQTVEDLRAENADLEDAVAQGEERVGLVDYLPVFSDSDVEFEDSGLDVVVDVEADEGDYDRVTANYTSDDGEYDVTVTQYEEDEDADDAVEDFRETQTPVEFSADGDEHTVTVNGYTGSFSDIKFEYDDADAFEDVDHEDDVEAVVVDGEDITDRVESVEHVNGDQVKVTLDEDYYVNDGESITVTYSDASDDGDLVNVQVWDGSWETFNYDEDDDYTEDIYRDGDTVVEVVGEDKGDEFDAQYADLTSQYE